MLLLLLLMAFVLSVVFMITYLNRRPLHHIPGPKPIPYFGNSFQLRLNEAHKFLTYWAKKYGDVYSIYLPGRKIVVVSGTKELHEVLVTKGKDFANREQSYRFQIGSNDKMIAFSNWSPKLRWQRQFVHSYIKQYGTGMETIEKLSLAKTKDFLKQLFDSREQPIDIKPLIGEFTANVIGTMLLGSSVERAENSDIITKLDRKVAKAFAFGGPGELLDTFPWLRIFGNECYTLMLELNEMRDSVINNWLDICQTTDTKEGFIRKCLDLSTAEKEQLSLNDNIIRLMIFQVIVTGTITTNSSLSALVSILVHHPKVQISLQDEVDMIVGHKWDVFLIDRNAMNFHQATLLELARYFSAVPLGVPHKAIKNSRVGRYGIPQDTVIWCNLWACHHDERLWDEPFKFRPERFLDANRVIIPADHPNRKNLFAFGAGPRVCLGEVFAQSRMFLFLANLMKHFTILPETTLASQTSCDPRECPFDGVLDLPDYKVRLQPRQK